MNTISTYSRVDRLVALIVAEKPRAARLVDLVELAARIDPAMPMVELRKAWTLFNNYHRQPRLGRAPEKSKF
ncbi:hypothetical protein [Phyllobacterium zundukense]|uniref:Uncharacterized protein n=1 Tax=Phyllobacterium zundukense TaxID=1867719 RepID=A0A2N9VQR9_9HYPH|nr:hypothetical protein [Phyllobacterium zundukense]ATU92273.1 hypothetical protein BLM14_11980 [Phyllobacterium zundukense]PIO41837.1 hypothetical protein B5P45_22420 [Phyllobacterium zundukense]